MTEALLVACIGVGGTLAGTIVTFAGTGLQQWRRNRADERSAREQAVSDVLSGATALSAGVQAYRTTWASDPWFVPSAMKLLSIFPLGRRTPGWHGRIAEVARDSRRDRQALAAEFHQVIMPRLERITKLLVDISLWRDRRSRRVVAAARDLSEHMGRLVEAAGASKHSYRKARAGFEESLRAFRAAVDG
ncbi:hypothetical protein [Nonomuraea sp. JJY05]|uniref:hypothetical protein n=1 Tax=Nonomuraea sp. JJY05 TaxID=3350255 RepID=UPI00373F300B